MNIHEHYQKMKCVISADKSQPDKALSLIKDEFVVNLKDITLEHQEWQQNRLVGDIHHLEQFKRLCEPAISVLVSLPLNVLCKSQTSAEGTLNCWGECSGGVFDPVGTETQCKPLGWLRKGTQRYQAVQDQTPAPH